MQKQPFSSQGLIFLDPNHIQTIEVPPFLFKSSSSFSRADACSVSDCCGEFRSVSSSSMPFLCLLQHTALTLVTKNGC